MDERTENHFHTSKCLKDMGTHSVNEVKCIMAQDEKADIQWLAKNGIPYEIKYFAGFHLLRDVIFNSVDAVVR